MAATGTTRISRDDVERAFQGIQDQIQGTVDDKKQSVLAAGATVAVVLLLIFFFLGKRAGRKKTTLVEIRRL
ncbi:MAG: hypothetical protein MUE78_02320 [Ilumatobacteraceae bacterium]|jgi:hypothetical protein|nr:hypothetical protein [Ilumatobacteraceae bacterium]